MTDSEWRSIETAPKDAVGVWFAQVSYGTQRFNVFGVGHRSGPNALWFYPDGKRVDAAMARPSKFITHWMPLPEPPK